MNDDCGTPAGSGTKPCAIFDLNPGQNTDGTGNINAAAAARFEQFVGSPPGPKCPTCPPACQAGANGTCN